MIWPPRSARCWTERPGHPAAAALAASKDIHQTYQRSGFGAAMAKFIALVTLSGPVPEGFAGQAAPDPAEFGLRAEDDGGRDDPLVGQNQITCTHYRHDFGALRAASTRLVIAGGAESRDLITGRCAAAVAERLGTGLVTFPGSHDGFLGGEYGAMGERMPSPPPCARCWRAPRSRVAGNHPIIGLETRPPAPASLSRAEHGKAGRRCVSAG